MKVAVDLDGVVYDFVGEFVRLARKYYFLNLDAPPLPEWEFYKAWGWDKDKFLEVYAALVDSHGLLRHGPILNHATAEVRRLVSAGHAVVFVSDRTVGRDPERSTALWLADNGLGDFDFHLTANKNSVEWDILLDDKPENYYAGWRTWHEGRSAILVDRPWNQPPDEGHRTRSIGTFVDTLLKVHPASGTEWTNWVVTSGSKPFIEDRIVIAPEAEVYKIDSLQGEVRTTSATGGQKGVKLARFDLIPTGPLFALAEHYGKGAAKYADHNWRKGYEWGKSYQALQRHATAFWGGETHDPETGSHHMAAVAFHAFALLEYAESHPEFDDRYVEVSE